LRIRHRGLIAISSRLRVKHKQSSVSRDSIRDHWSFSDGFRWSLTMRFPNRVKKWAVVWSIFALVCMEAARYFRSGDRQYLSAMQGHLDFLRRLIMRKDVEKLRALS